MENIDVLLMNVPTNRGYKKELADVISMPPLGVLYLASHIKKSGYKVEIMDMAVDFYKKKEFITILKDKNPKIVGISTFVESWSAMKVLADSIKQALPNAVIVGGGACATFCYEQLLKELKYDYVIFGEGEYAFADLCDALIKKQMDIRKVKGISYLIEGNIHLTEKKERIKDLDQLEIPSRNLIDLKKYVYPITISTSRGCPGECIFCSSKSFWGKEIYFRSPQNILYEILQVEKEYSINMFFIIDDAFTMNVKRAMEFCDLLKATNKKFIWGCESRADVASEILLQSLYDAGCRKIQFGMESANNEILRKIGKHVTVEQIENAVKIASKIGFDINVSFILGHPFDTHETVQQTIIFALKLREMYKANVFGSILTPYPGTQLYNNAEEYGIKILTKDWDKFTMDNAIINTKHLTAFDLREYYQRFVNVLLGKSRMFVAPTITKKRKSVL
ncbi:B12-binding domain-containing radical SAM protein [Clostridium estertheticum]|uniref:B12-binding domain-containing radical SAM protein n=1 Tax=Clostridium estertheticum TaxID=238834 RepID=UPI001478D74B|nr:radical SAM protein [Clostridium estertheticum]MBU3171910.1 B12-binding domain-containing radical SAM protein [Clostridium estertheticum]MBZ9618360.1 B12-binding domain-containing radical SAM protein [Clostridium estertheticum subsp. laramiense]WAG76143.1 B12-binding domain-containing radical SAM protein [Clostridium estertheticum]